MSTSKINSNFYSSFNFKRKTFDNKLKVKEKFLLKKKNNNNNNTDYSSLGVNKSSLSNKIINFNKSKSRISLIKSRPRNPIKLNLFSSSEKSKFNNFIENKNKTININKKINNNSISHISNSVAYPRNKKIKYNYFSGNKTIHFLDLNYSSFTPKIRNKKENINIIKDKENIIQLFNKKLLFKNIQNILKKYKYKSELEKEEEKKANKICLLNKDFNVKNFVLKPQKVIEYLNLNENKDFFVPSSTKKNLYKFRKKFNFSKNHKVMNRNNSAHIESKLERINSIYPNVLNIEGQINRKILNELNNEAKIRKKNEKPNCVYYKQHFNLKKRMIFEKSKLEAFARKNTTEFAYRSKLLILSMKIYQRAIHYLEKKNSLKFNLDLPSYNLFLNLN